MDIVGYLDSNGPYLTSQWAHLAIGKVAIFEYGAICYAACGPLRLHRWRSRTPSTDRLPQKERHTEVTDTTDLYSYANEQHLPSGEEDFFLIFFVRRDFSPSDFRFHRSSAGSNVTVKEHWPVLMDTPTLNMMELCKSISIWLQHPVNLVVYHTLLPSSHRPIDESSNLHAFHFINLFFPLSFMNYSSSMAASHYLINRTPSK